ncbi:MAG: beta-N-acetylhexosaminidase [Actinobacteria bacterium]|nr:beta-N-acetylhexosaminidase [Actinomycetota bacterium]
MAEKNGPRRTDRYATDKRFGKRSSSNNSRNKENKAKAKADAKAAKAQAKADAKAAKARAKAPAIGAGNKSAAIGGGLSGGNKPPRKSRFKSPLFWIIVVVVLALAAGGAVFALKARGQADSGAAQIAADIGNDSGSDSGDTSTAPMPLASSTDQIVADMTLEEKIGQMMMVGFEGGEAGPQITSAITDKHIGAVILYGRNISSHEQVAALDAALQTAAAQAKQPAKLMIAIDQEGGATRRFTDIGPYYSEPMNGEMTGGAGAAAAQQQASSAARDLKKLGINTNLAPDVDVSSGWGSVMDGRSFGPDSEVVTELGGKAVTGYNNATMISCPKHFPGHGSADGSSEESLPTVDLDLATIQASELPPFQEVIKQNAPMIMVAHLSVPALDATGTASSLSKPIVTDLLRKGLSFNGVIITDDLEMGAITSNMSVADAAVAAVTAGNDMVMVAQTAANENAAYDALLTAVKSGKIGEDQINKSVARIIDMKKKYRLEND